MSSSQVDEEATSLHRRLASEANNRAWGLSVQTRNATDDHEMLNAAHASAWHWSKVGTELNSMRATMLLAETHAVLGLGTSAFAYAEEMREYFLRVGAPEWEVAFVHTIHAHAAAAAGKVAEHRASYQLAVKALSAVSNEEDRSVVASTFGHVPKP